MDILQLLGLPDAATKAHAVAELGTELMRFDMGVSKRQLEPHWDQWLELQQKAADLLLKALERQPDNDL